MKLSKDLREFIELLNSEHVDYLIVGGFAVAFHGHPRFTGDIDFLVRMSPENAQRMETVVRAFGFASTGLSAADFTVANQIIQLGQPPNRIDVLTSISGVSFDDAWLSRVASTLDGIAVAFIGKDALISNKRATGRPKDLADIAELE